MGFSQQSLERPGGQTGGGDAGCRSVPGWTAGTGIRVHLMGEGVMLTDVSTSTRWHHRGLQGCVQFPSLLQSMFCLQKLFLALAIYVDLYTHLNTFLDAHSVERSILIFQVKVNIP